MRWRLLFFVTLVCWGGGCELVYAAVCHEVFAYASASVSLDLEGGGTGAVSSRCWRVQPALGSGSSSSETTTPPVVEIVLTSLDIYASEIHLYDGESSFDTPIWNCVSAADECRVIPPPLRAHSGSVYILWKTATSLAQLGVELSYFTMYENTASNVVTMHMPYAELNSPSYDGRLPKGIDFRWVLDLDTAKNAAYGPTTLMVRDVNLPEGGGNCTSYVAVYDGLDVDTSASLAVLCGGSATPSEWIVSSGPAMLVRLHIDDNAGDEGDEGLTVPGWFNAAYYVDGESYRCGSVDDPMVLTGPSMMFTDGTRTQEPMQSGQECSWLVQPDVAAQEGVLMMVFYTVSVKYGGRVQVYDGVDDGSASQLLWDCDGCGEIVPPPLPSASGSLYIHFYSNSFEPYDFLGFSGFFYTVSDGNRGMGNGREEVRASRATIRPPLTATGQPGTMPDDVLYQWLIAPKTESTITFAFEDVDLPDCDGDRLTLHDGGTTDDPVLGTFCGTDEPDGWIESTGSEVLAVLETDDNENAGGFALQYYTDSLTGGYRCGYIDTEYPAVLTMPSFLLWDGSARDDDLRPQEACEWLIEPFGAAEIVLLLDRVSIGRARIQVFDGHNANGDVLWECAGCDIIPPHLHAASGTMYITLVSGNDPAGDAVGHRTSLASLDLLSHSMGRGFEARYYATYKNSGGQGMGNSTEILRAASGLVRPPGAQSDGTYPGGLDYLWYIDPESSTSNTTTLVFRDLWMPDCNDRVTIYDGLDTGAPVLATFCGETVPRDWIVASSPRVLVRFETDESNNDGHFELLYHTDGGKYRCGYVRDPTLTMPSFVISDGTATDDSLREGEHCEWRLEPEHPSVPEGSAYELALSFDRLAIQGGRLWVYEGKTSTEGRLLWHCRHCDVLPPVLVASSGYMFIEYDTTEKYTNGSLGTGFEAHYFTVLVDSAPAPAVADGSSSGGGGPSLGSQGVQLRQPAFASDHSRVADYVWRLPLGGAAKGVAEVFPTLAFGNVWRRECELEEQLTGYPANGDQRGAPPIDSLCGSALLPSGTTATLDGPLLVLPVSEHAQRSYYRGGQEISTPFGEGVPSYECSHLTSVEVSVSDIVTAEPCGACSIAPIASDLCQWRLMPTQEVASVELSLNWINLVNGSSVRIYEGFDARGKLLYLCDGCNEPPPKPLVSRCGNLFVVYEGNMSHGGTDHGLELQYAYQAGSRAELTVCTDLGVEVLLEDTDADAQERLLIMMLTCAAIFLVTGLLVTHWYRSHYRIGDRLAYSQRNIPYHKRIEHPKHTKLDQIRNLALPMGECCICMERTKVFKLHECGHEICMEDLRSYLMTALGDASMFPLKCPMHHSGCETTINAPLSKRVLDRQEYDKFNAFNDRAIFGDGMECLLCHAFVNVAPLVGTMVECPQCRHRFCIRCKTTWHQGMTCEEFNDEEDQLENWRRLKGASRCPGCNKIIEKDDPETCNHMVHKATDNIPCLRARTDFCYCCGMEVTNDYPHLEIDNMKINHFPDGVFDDCRVVRDGYSTMIHQYNKGREERRGQRRQRRRTTLARVVPVTVESPEPQENYMEYFQPELRAGGLPAPRNADGQRHFG